MTREEIRNIILQSEEGKDCRMVIAEKDYLTLRQEVSAARKMEYELEYYSKKLGGKTRKVIFTKQKEGDALGYKKRYKIE